MDKRVSPEAWFKRAIWWETNALDKVDFRDSRRATNMLFDGYQSRGLPIPLDMASSIGTLVLTMRA